MVKIALISCVSKKLPHKAKAKFLYISPLFKMNLKFAESFSPKDIFILSAKYGLIDLEEEIEPYDKTLNKMSSNDKKDWAKNVLDSLRKRADLENDEFIFLAGENYRKCLIEHIKHYKIPMYGLSIGKQLQYLKGHMQ